MALTKIQKNWINLSIFSLFLVILYLTYKVEILTFLCETESNAPACYLLAENYDEEDDLSKSSRYLEISCELKYERACSKISR